MIPLQKFSDRRGTTKKLSNKDFAEPSGELSGVVCLKIRALLDNALELFRNFFGAVRAIFGFVSPSWPLKIQEITLCNLLLVSFLLTDLKVYFLWNKHQNLRVQYKEGIGRERLTLLSDIALIDTS